MPGFTAPKLLWVLKHEPQIIKRIHKVLLPKDCLRDKLSGEAISDRSYSAGTLWLDTEKREWSEQMLSATHLSKDQMSTLVEGSELRAELSADLTREWGLSSSPVIAGGAGDNAAGAIGMGAVEPENTFLSLGTSGVYLVVQPDLPAKSGSASPRLLSLYPEYMASNGSHSQRFQLPELDCRCDPTERIGIYR